MATLRAAIKRPPMRLLSNLMSEEYWSQYRSMKKASDLTSQ